MLVYILGVGHCGSTLLDLLLNGHSRILGLGELIGLHRYVEIANLGEIELKPGDWLERTTHPFDDPMWQAVRTGFEAQTGRRLEELRFTHPHWIYTLTWPRHRVLAWAEAQAALLNVVHEASQMRILTDSSKHPERLALLNRSGLFDLRVIHLVRDARGVINSYRRKYGNGYIALRRWLGPTIKCLWALTQVRRDHWTRVRYEDLCRDPETTLRGICNFLGVEFESHMLQFRSTPYLGIGGNRMQSSDSQSIRLDDSWNTELDGVLRAVATACHRSVDPFLGYRRF